MICPLIALKRLACALVVGPCRNNEQHRIRLGDHLTPAIFGQIPSLSIFNKPHHGCGQHSRQRVTALLIWGTVICWRGGLVLTVCHGIAASTAFTRSTNSGRLSSSRWIM